MMPPYNMEIKLAITWAILGIALFLLSLVLAGFQVVVEMMPIFEGMLELIFIWRAIGLIALLFVASLSPAMLNFALSPHDEDFYA